MALASESRKKKKKNSPTSLVSLSLCFPVAPLYHRPPPPPLPRIRIPAHNYNENHSNFLTKNSPETAGRSLAPTTSLLAPAAENGNDSELDDDSPSAVQRFLYPEQKELPDDFAMPIWDHLDELRERVLLAALAAAVAVAGCFAFSKDLVVFLEAPVADQGVRFLQLSPGEFFFTTLKVAGYAGLLLATPTVLYEVVAYVVPGLTRSERKLLAPIIFGSGILFYAGLVFSYEVLTPAALNFFVSYADGAVESLWSIDQYFEFVLVLMLSTGELRCSFFNFGIFF